MRGLSMIVIYCSPAFMKRRFVGALIVALTVLFSQGGVLVWAATCPHARSQQPDTSCHMGSDDANAEHHAPAEAKGEAFQTHAPDVRCNHCVVHSRSKREDSALQQTNAPQRASDQKQLVSISKVEPPSFLKPGAWSAAAQGPPGPTAPLHVLLNVYRI